MAKINIRRGDRVKVISGNDKGAEGTVVRVDREKNRVVVQGVNVRKRHRKPSATSPEGGIVEFEAPIHASNVMLLDPRTGEPTRVRSGQAADGKRERIAVKSGQAIPRAS
jgi:large subunit ribosomal protein L24